MASDNGLQALAERLGKVADLTAGDMSPMGHAVGKHARIEARTIADAVTGGDSRLSHMGRRGTRLSMGYDLEQRGAVVITKLRPGGAWVLTEKGAKSHTIGVRRARARGVGSGWGITATVWAPSYAHPTSKPFTHPGAGGKQSITRTFGRIRGRASRDWHDEYVQQLAKVMGA